MILTIICIVFAPKNCKDTLKEFDIDHIFVGGGVQKASGLISVSKELNALGALIQYILACLCVLSNLKGR